jgi:hypothetical protein
VIFHWPPSAMDNMPLPELMDWREQARLRAGNTDDE